MMLGTIVARSINVVIRGKEKHHAPLPLVVQEQDRSSQPPLEELVHNPPPGREKVAEN